MVDVLRSLGHDVDYVAEISPSIDDDAVLRNALADGRILLTSDKDFGELIFRQNKASTAVILVRLDGLSPQTKAQVVADFIGEHGDQIGANFVVIRPGIIRFRLNA